jgi:hypothetical protein
MATTGDFANLTPTTGASVISMNTLKAHTVSNGTQALALWRLAGSIWVKKFYAITETALSSNVTAAHWRLNDQTATPAITLATGETLSSMVVGQMISVNDLPAVKLLLSGLTNTAKVSFPAVKQTQLWQEFQLIKKTGANTDIEFVYTSTNTPATGAFRHYIEFVPLSLDGALTAL